MKKYIDTEKIEKEFREREEDIELEKGDRLAIFLSALMVFGPVILAFFAIFFGLVFLSTIV